MRNDVSILLKFKIDSNSAKHFELQLMSNKNTGYNNDDYKTEAITTIIMLIVEEIMAMITSATMAILMTTIITTTAM